MAIDTRPCEYWQALTRGTAHADRYSPDIAWRTMYGTNYFLFQLLPRPLRHAWYRLILLDSPRHFTTLALDTAVRNT